MIIMTSNNPKAVVRKQGYPLAIIEESDYRKYHCGHCDLLPRMPMQTDCGHRYCATCVDELLQQVTSILCLLCQKEDSTSDEDIGIINKESIFPDKGIMREYKKIKAVCVNKMYGCTWTGFVIQYDEHEIVCQFILIDCNLCDKEVLKLELESHDCQPPVCEYIGCQTQVRKPSVKQHEIDVVPQHLQYVNSHVREFRDDLLHLMSVLTQMEKSIIGEIRPDMNATSVKNASQLDNFQPKERLPLNDSRSDVGAKFITSHMETEQSNDTDMETGLSHYTSMGTGQSHDTNMGTGQSHDTTRTQTTQSHDVERKSLNVSDSSEQRSLKDPCMSNTHAGVYQGPHGPLLTLDSLSLDDPPLEEYVGYGDNLQPETELSYSSLVANFDSVELDSSNWNISDQFDSNINTSGSKRENSLVKILISKVKKKPGLLSEIDYLSTKIKSFEYVQEHITRVLSSSNEQASKILTAKELIDKMEEKVSLLENKIISSNKQPVSYNGVLTWRIENFLDKMDHAQNRTGETSFWSQSFYTSIGGYKLQARVFPYGDGIGVGSHVSLFIAVLKTDFDDALEWPFTKTLKMIVLDQNETKSHYEDTFQCSGTMYFQKPREERSRATGKPMFIPHELVKSQAFKYIGTDGSLFIRIVVLPEQKPLGPFTYPR